MSHAEHHISSIKTLAIVFAGLVFLTVLTVITAEIELGALHVPLALSIAILKAALVVVIFMGLRWDNKINTAIFGIGILFVMVFISFILFDTLNRGDSSSTFKGTVEEQRLEDEALKTREPEASTIELNRMPQ